MLMLAIFQTINYQYLMEVKVANKDGEDEDVYQMEMEALQGKGSIIATVGDLAHVFAIALILQLIFKGLFNIWSQITINIDQWTIIDAISAIINVMAV